MKKIVGPIIIFISMLACVQRKTTELNEHPLESNLIPNVQIDSEPKKYGVEERLMKHNVTGIILGVIENYELEFSKGYGLSRTEPDIGMDNFTISAAGSISKSIVALITLILEEQGKISLDEDVSKYFVDWELPESKFTTKEKITLRRLLNHRAGINPFNSKGVDRSKKSPDLLEVLEGEGHPPGVSIDTIPGAIYKYSNLGYGIIQLALESRTEKSLEELAQELVFQPLEMNDSSFKRVVPNQENMKYAYAYDNDGNVYKGFWRKALIPASGGLKSTVGDLSKLLLTISEALKGYHSGPVSPNIAEQIISERGYNLGFEINGKGKDLSVTHTGRMPGFFAYMRMYPRTGKGLIMLCNSDNGGEMFKDILRGASELYGWDIIKPRVITPIQISSEKLKKYQGEYELIIESTTYVAQIVVEGQELQLKMRNEEDTYPLIMIGSNTFVDLIDGSDLKFILKDSVVTSLLLDNDLTFTKIQ